MARDVTKLHPKLQTLIVKFIAECKKNGIIVKIGECIRTVAEQDDIYAQGRTKPGTIVTKVRGSSYSSMHQWGIAFDFYLDMDVDGDGSTKDDAFNNATKLFDKAGKIGKSIGLEWGGGWTSIIDRPHFQLQDWGSTPTKLKSLYGTPDKFIASWSKSTVTQPIPPVSKFDFKDWVKRLQREIGANADGIPGMETLGRTPTVEKPDHGNIVSLVQERLISLGYDLGKYGKNKDGVDGKFGTMMEDVIKKYQKSIGITRPDGIVTGGKTTWKALLNLK